ncbi:MAG: dihydroorotase [Bacteroidota bacterium]|nr:dihydroorotase [Bacteroidota bacterium]
MNRILIKNAKVVNESKVEYLDVLVEGDVIEKIDKDISHRNATVIDAFDLYMIPGIIDDQVHFREPGLTHKATIYAESRAAAAGGVTSFMEMPNTNPLALTAELLEQKFEIAKRDAAVNYSFYMGTSNSNHDHVLKMDYSNVCGIKIFMGSSSGDMLVDNIQSLENLFKNANTLIATHCENEQLIKNNLEQAIKNNGEQLTIFNHPVIRSSEACYASSSFAIELAKKHNTRLHVLHISTKDELELFSRLVPLSQKRITSEVCVHHMLFNEEDYGALGNKIKCNPAIKSKNDSQALIKALTDGILDVVATDHAPHTLEEKNQHYLKAPAGLPLVQHALGIMLLLAAENNWPIEFVVEKMCHNPAQCFQIQRRGFIREGYFADLVLLDLKHSTLVQKENILYKCAWSPLEGRILPGKINMTMANGQIVWDGANILQSSGQRLLFDPR